MKLENVVALVTGGASGLGRATVEEFLRGGARVVIADLPHSPGEALAKELGDRARFAPTDVTNEQEVSAAVQTAVSEFGALNVAVNCAGIAWAQRTVDKNGPHPLEVFSKVIQVNLIGTFNVIRIAATQMSQQELIGEERGVIVNTASIAAYDGQIGQVAYAASKGGVVSMTLPIARDLSARNIRVCTIAPGIMNTQMLALLPDDARAALAANVPNPKRLGEPSEYGLLARHIVENPYLNGETIRLDAALRMPPK